jgi:hypothetical protein
MLIHIGWFELLLICLPIALLVRVLLRQGKRKTVETTTRDILGLFSRADYIYYFDGRQVWQLKAMNRPDMMGCFKEVAPRGIMITARGGGDYYVIVRPSRGMEAVINEKELVKE